jgi:hypothetical protein
MSRSPGTPLIREESEERYDMDMSNYEWTPSPSKSNQKASRGNVNFGMSNSMASIASAGSSYRYDDDDDDDLMSSALGSDDGREFDDDLDSTMINQSNGDDRPEGWVDPDILYGDELGYWVIMLLRGSTCGRRIKRCVFKLAVAHILANIALIVMAYLEDRLYNSSPYFETSPYGASLHYLMWCTCIPGMFVGFLNVLFLKYWASIVTNRLLFTQMLRILVAAEVICLGFAVWMISVLLLMFDDVKRWNDDLQLSTIFPFYLCTIIFTFPYIAAVAYYTLDITFWMDELVNANGDIKEPNPPVDVMDLTDVSLNQVLLLVAAMPCLVSVQIFDLSVACYHAILRYITNRTRERREVEENRRLQKEMAENEAARGRTSVWNRAVRTAKRRWKACFAQCCPCWCGEKKKVMEEGEMDLTEMGLQNPYANMAGPGSPGKRPQQGGDEKEGDDDDNSAHLFTGNDREVTERLARIKAEEEQEKKLAAKAVLEQVERDAQAERDKEERERQMVIAKREQEQLMKENAKNSVPVLDVPSFKAHWAHLKTAGSFHCKLKSKPELNNLIAHMKKQGFHVVFASSPSPNEIEIGICNIRENLDGEAWFLARFLASGSGFSAVMKSEDATITSVFVKKFALAKVLRIDTKAGATNAPTGSSPLKAFSPNKASKN